MGSKVVDFGDLGLLGLLGVKGLLGDLGVTGGDGLKSTFVGSSMVFNDRIKKINANEKFDMNRNFFQTVAKFIF